MKEIGFYDPKLGNEVVSLSNKTYLLFLHNRSHFRLFSTAVGRIIFTEKLLSRHALRPALIMWTWAASHSIFRRCNWNIRIWPNLVDHTWCRTVLLKVFQPSWVFYTLRRIFPVSLHKLHKVLYVCCSQIININPLWTNPMRSIFFPKTHVILFLLGTVNSVELYCTLEPNYQDTTSKALLNSGTWDSAIYSMQYAREMWRLERKLNKEKLPRLRPKLWMK